MLNLSRQLGFREMLLEVLRTSMRRESTKAVVVTTPQSISYRRSAADLARLAESEMDEIKLLPIIHQTLSWIQLAENEEILAENTGLIS